MIQKRGYLSKIGSWYKLQCRFCKSIFSLQGFKYREGKGKYCSRKCYFDSKKTEIKCVLCNKKYLKYSQGKGLKYCSQKCMGFAYRNEGNPCWRGGRSRLPYHHSFREKLKKEIRKRDNYTCRICGKDNLSSFDAHVHHLNGDKLNCMPENLTVVCRWCHGSISARGIYQI